MLEIFIKITKVKMEQYIYAWGQSMKQSISDHYSIITELSKIKLKKAKSFGSLMNHEYWQIW